MTNYMQRTSNKGEFNNPVMISFKTDLMGKFYDLVGKEMKDVGAHYFAHHLIKNHCQEGHTISSFVTHPDWQEKYWKDYWDCDPVDYASFTIAKINGSAVVSWKVVDPDSDCMEDRKTMCKMNDGFRFDIQHDNGILENFSFGWERYDVNRVNRQKLVKLSSMITGFRLQHFKRCADLFDTLPTILTV